MRAPTDADLLALWERGAERHLLDQALLLCAWARADVAPAALADLPLGAVNAALLGLRRACFGERIEAWLDCAQCGERLEIALDAGALLAKADREPPAELAVGDFRFRPPSSRDLAAVASERDPQRAALRLLERCCVARPEAPAADVESLVAEVEHGLDAIDPLADLALTVSCDACGHVGEASLDPAALLWDEIAARARTLLAEVHVLARAYGWSEPEILALGPQRRAAYLALVSP